MNRENLIRRLRRFCQKTGREMEVERAKGKGSHARITVDGRKTTIKSGELNPRYVALVLKQLGLPRDAVD